VLVNQWLGNPVPGIADTTLVKATGNQDVTDIWEVRTSSVYRLGGQRLTN
jgi:hypothetical protein